MNRPITAVDISEKKVTRRTAVAVGTVRVRPETLAAILSGQIEKGDVFSTAQVAGIMGAKQTPHIVPLCHPLLLSHIRVRITPVASAPLIAIEATVKTSGQTGVEMEAMTAVCTTFLTIYDMCKAIDRDMMLTDVALIEKSGGRSGTYKRR